MLLIPEESFINKVNKEMDQIWVRNHIQKEYFSESGIIDERIILFPACIDTKIFKPSNSLKSIDGHFSYLYLSYGFSPESINFLISAFSDEFEEDNNISLTIHVNKEIENISAYFPLKDNIKISSGFKNKNEIKNLFDQHNAFVYPFFRESSGTIVLEATASGIPVIITNSIFPETDDNSVFLIDSELLEESGKNNLHYFQPDEDRLRMLMREVKENYQAAIFKANRLSERIINNYSWQSFQNNIKKSLKDIFNKPVVRFNINEIIENYKQIALSSFSEDNFSQAETFLFNLTKLFPLNPEYHYKLGVSLYNLGKYEKAIDTFSVCLEQSSFSFDLCNYLAICLEKTGDSETAEIYYQKAEEYK